MLFWSSLDDNFDDKIFSWIFETQREHRRWLVDEHTKDDGDETILSFETSFVLSAHRGDIKYGWMSLSGNEWRMEKSWSSRKDEDKRGETEWVD